jgi:beta-lactamase regulating signal transducer with metallopeptidase domain
MLCILYVITISTCLGVIGLLTEHALPTTSPRRWIWLVVVALSLAIPPVYRVRHKAMVHDASVMHASSQDARLSQLLLLSMWVSAALAIAQGFRVTRLVRRTRREAAVVDGVASIITDSIGPATVGILGARVFIPRWVLALPPVQRRYVLRHEQEHRTAHDTLVLFAASLACVMVPWNPAMWWQLRRLRLAVEMDCDHRVVAALGDARAYGVMLLGIAEAASRQPDLQPALLGIGMLEQRISRLVAPSTRTLAARVLASVAALALLYVVLMLPHPITAH